MVLRVLVEDPRHDLPVRVHVGRGDVLGGADEVVDAVDELARHALALSVAERVGFHRDAALGAAEGDARDGRLPGHQRGQRGDLCGVHMMVIAEATLERAARVVVLDAEADEGAHRAVVHPHVQLDADLPMRRLQLRRDVLPELEGPRGPVDEVLRVL